MCQGNVAISRLVASAEAQYQIQCRILIIEAKDDAHDDDDDDDDDDVENRPSTY